MNPHLSAILLGKVTLVQRLSFKSWELDAFGLFAQNCGKKASRKNIHKRDIYNKCGNNAHGAILLRLGIGK